MKRLPLLLVGALIGAHPALAAPGGVLKTLPKGYWVCETQGDADTPGHKLPQDSFRVIPDSSYRLASGGTGTYVLLGNALTITSGPFQGRRYTLTAQGLLHPLDASGNPATDRCVRQGSAAITDAGQ